MLDALKRLIVGPDPLLKAIDRGDGEVIHDILSRRRFSVASDPSSEGLDPEIATDEEILEQVERELEAFNSISEIIPRSIPRDGQDLVLAFTHQRYLERYCVKRFVSSIELSGFTPTKSMAPCCWNGYEQEHRLH